jgi:uncharacterized protein YndB with AHSA1/START domain
MSTPAAFGEFTIERRYDVPPARVFAAFAQQDQKDAWYIAAHDLWTPVERTFDFRVGGSEIVAGRWASGMITRMDAYYHDIVDGRRIVFTYGLTIDGRRVSVSQTTIELEPDGEGTLMTFTEQGCFLDGFVDGGGREKGTREILGRMEATLKEAIVA